MHYMHRGTHCLHYLSCKEAPVQKVESLNRFQAHFRFLHRLHQNRWTCAFSVSVVHSVAFQQRFSLTSVFVEPVSVSLLYLVVTLNGRSRDFVDPRL